jgi:serine/threonine protein kinase
MVIMGVAASIPYLHGQYIVDTGPSAIPLSCRRDIKTANILLNSDLAPVIPDLWLAKIDPGDNAIHSMK